MDIAIQGDDVTRRRTSLFVPGQPEEQRLDVTGIGSRERQYFLLIQDMNVNGDTLW